MKNDLEIHGGEVSRRSEFFFWAFAVLALFLFLGHNALWASEERWAEVAREMLLSGDWLHPSLNWVIYFDKPQLSYWLILPFAVLLGGMDELVVRIPSALAGLAALYGVVSLGKTLFDKRTALLAGWMLLSCYGFLFWSRTAAGVKRRRHHQRTNRNLLVTGSRYGRRKHEGKRGKTYAGF